MAVVDLAVPSTSGINTKKITKPKEARAAANHPKVADMVNSAIVNLKERNGSTLPAIKKYISGNYSVDIKKLAPYINKYLKTAVDNDTLVRTKGAGASGSFKLSAAAKKPVEKKPEKPKSAETKKAAKLAAKPKNTEKVAKPKKAVDDKKAAQLKKRTDEKKKTAATKPNKQKKSTEKTPPAKPKKMEAKAKKTKADTKSPKPKKVPAKKTAKK